MAKSVPDSVMDAILDEIATSTLQSVVSDATTPTDLVSTLADIDVAGVDFTKSVGDAGAGSRKLTVAAKSGAVVTAGGTPNHVVLSLTDVIKLVTTCSGPELTVDSVVDFPSWTYEIGVPA